MSANNAVSGQKRTITKPVRLFIHISSADRQFSSQESLVEGCKLEAGGHMVRQMSLLNPTRMPNEHFELPHRGPG